jgi:hypothetical protein
MLCFVDPTPRIKIWHTTLWQIMDQPALSRHGMKHRKWNIGRCSMNRHRMGSSIIIVVVIVIVVIVVMTEPVLFCLLLLFMFELPHIEVVAYTTDWM